MWAALFNCCFCLPAVVVIVVAAAVVVAKLSNTKCQKINLKLLPALWQFNYRAQTTGSSHLKRGPPIEKKTQKTKNNENKKANKKEIYPIAAIRCVHKNMYT